MRQQRRESFHPKRGINISRSNVCMAALGNATSLDSHYILDDNGMMHGVTQYNNRIQHQQNLVRGAPAFANRYYSGWNPSTSTAMSQNYQCFNTSVSSSAAPPNAGYTENDIPLMPRCSLWSRSWESMMVNDHSHLIQGNYSAPPFQPVAPPWSNQQLNSNHGYSYSVAWHQTLPMHYVPASRVNEASLDNAMMGLSRYYDNAGSRSGRIISHPPPVNQQFHSFHQTQCLQEIRGYPINLHPSFTAHSPAHSRRVPADPPHPPRSSSRHVGYLPRAHIYRSRRGHVCDTTRRHQNLTSTSLPLDDDITLLSNHHSNMALNIDDIAYEVFSVLGDMISKVSTGLTEEMITSQMKTKIYILPTEATNLEEANFQEQEPDCCVICQDEYMNQDKIGILRCGHEYHADCLRKWLHQKNVCPICKAEALYPCDKKQ